jgi:peptide/nickel transport system permease protein
VTGPLPVARPTARRRSGVPATVWIGGVVVGSIAAAALLSFLWTPWSPLYTDVAHRSVGPFTAGHVLGTDLRGRDILSLLMAGARTTLWVGIVAVGIAAVVGTPLGILAGMAGRGPAEFLMRVTDLWLAFPALLMALILAAVFGGSVTTSMVAIGVATVPAFIRVVRAGTRQVMISEFVAAARVAGRSGPAIAVRHVLPNVAPLIIVQSSVAYAIAILAEASLSFLGLGAGPTTPSWGRMLYEAQPALTFQPWMMLWPGLAVLAAVLAFNLLGDGLRDRLDPRLAGR